MGSEEKPVEADGPLKLFELGDVREETKAVGRPPEPFDGGFPPNNRYI
jgi:hypothetical protein